MKLGVFFLFSFGVFLLFVCFGGVGESCLFVCLGFFVVVVVMAVWRGQWPF